MSIAQYVQISVELWGTFFCWVSALVVFLSRKVDERGSHRLIALLLVCSFMLAFDVFAWAFRGDESHIGYYMARVSNFGAFLCGFGALVLAVRYVAHLVEIRTGFVPFAWQYVEYAIGVLGVILLVENVCTPFIYTFDATNHYLPLTYYWLLGILSMLGLALTLGIVIRYFDVFRPFERLAMVAYLSLPLVAVVVQTFIFGMSYTSIATAVATLILFFSYEINYVQYVSDLERRRNADRLKILSSQMRPHFIFNTLSLIRYLSRRRPDEVPEAIDELSSFLRGCTDLLDEDVCVPATQEFKLVQSYAYLQELRFENEVRVEFELDDVDFKLPAFCVQTAVENAITHGLRNTELREPGVVRVRSFARDGAHVVEVEDNGIGFNFRALDKDDGTHTGIRTTRDRLQLMCTGTYDVRSESGSGTKVTIRVPVQQG